MKTAQKSAIVITPGDPEGIGPEVTAKALSALKKNLAKKDVIIFGSKKPFRKYLKELKTVTFFEPPERSSPGYQAGWAIEAATQYVMAAPKTRVLVTGPISKDRLQKAGYPFHGHTDFLAHLSKAKQVSMMLANDQLRVVLVTNHCSLHDVSKKVTPESLFNAFSHAYAFAHDFLGKKKPLIAVLGLNPHAGEEGMLGKEEKELIIPAMKEFQRRFPNALLTGPHPSDSFFAVEMMRRKKRAAGHDVIVAMYHDQGLIPVKLSGFSNSLNISLGLPFIRTSVDHGTAFDIAGKNRADPGSMIYAIKKAMEYSQ